MSRGNIAQKREIPYLQGVFRQINDMISIKAKGSELIKHSLEKGLSNEAIIREILRDVLPKCYGVGKGKVVSASGEMSRQCDVIIYDALNCPTLFVDENRNQILPIEGIYAVIEIKTQLTSTKMKEGFKEISSVKNLSKRSLDVSTNDHLSIIPPLGHVISYKDRRSLETIYENYNTLNKQYKRNFSSLFYSKKSPSYAQHTNQYFLVEDIVIVNKGIIHYMFDGFPVILPCGADSLGVFIVELFVNLQVMKLPLPNLSLYYGDVILSYETKTKTKNGYLEINEARERFWPP